MQIYDYDRDYKDVGVAKFTIKFVVIRNCLPGAKCDTVLSAWNPPSEWGKYAAFTLPSVPCSDHSFLYCCYFLISYFAIPIYNHYAFLS